MVKVQTDFLPHTHGFPFKNAFEQRLPLHYDLPLSGPVDLNEVSDGLCGGMCFAALDYFKAGQRPPAVADERLLDYLRGRQVDSLRVTTILKIIEGLLLEVDERKARLLGREVPKLRRRLDKGQPAVLALLYPHAQAGQAASHFVIAVGYDLDERTSQLSFNLYDPNQPGTTQRLAVSLSSGNLKYGSAPLAGFILIPYKLTRNRLWQYGRKACRLLALKRQQLSN